MSRHSCGECGYLIVGAVYQCEYWGKLLTVDEINAENWCRGYWGCLHANEVQRTDLHKMQAGGKRHDRKG